MEQFDYVAQSRGGAAISGFLEAADGTDAMATLRAMGLQNIELSEARRPRVCRPLGSDDFIFFNEQLSSLAGTGICLDVGLRQLGKDIRSPRLRLVLDALAADVERGQPLDEAIENRAPQLPALYARVVRAGVKSGQLPATLLNLSHHLRLVSETRRLVSEALTYPAIVLILALGVLCAALLIVVPQFVGAFEDFGIRLPPVTAAMVGLARVLPEVLLVLGLIIVGSAIGCLLLGLTSSGRALRERFTFFVPFAGAMIRNSLRARFLRSMAFAVNSGIPLPEAIRLSAGATASPALSRDADCVAARVEQGGAVFEACRGRRVIPAMFGYVVDVGSRGLDLPNSLVQLSKGYESGAVHCQRLLRSWLAPVAVIGVGIVIGLMVLALFMPLAALLQSVS